MSAANVYLKQLELGPMQNFIYLIGDPATREAAVVDPGWEVPAILQAAEQDGYRITRAIVTHHHFDHVMGLPELLKTVDVPVHVHREDASLVKIEPGNRKAVAGGDVITVGRVPIQLIHTPGHTAGSQCLLVDGRLFSGDTLFIRSCGRCDFPDSSPRALFETLSTRLKPLDDETILCPGHNYADTPTARFGDEKQHNPFLAAPTLEQFLSLVGAAA